MMRKKSLDFLTCVVVCLIVGSGLAAKSTIEHRRLQSLTSSNSELVDLSVHFLRNSSNACGAGQLAVVAGAGNGAAGTAFLPIVFVNVSTATCWLYGYPELMMSNGGAPSGMKAVHQSYGVYANVSPRVVILKSGGDASVGFSYSDNSTTNASGQSTACHSYTQIKIEWSGLHNLRWSIRIASVEMPCGPRFSITPFEKGALPAHV